MIWRSCIIRSNSRTLKVPICYQNNQQLKQWYPWQKARGNTLVVHDANQEKKSKTIEVSSPESEQAEPVEQACRANGKEAAGGSPEVLTKSMKKSWERSCPGKNAGNRLAELGERRMLGGKGQSTTVVG